MYSCDGNEGDALATYTYLSFYRLLFRPHSWLVCSVTWLSWLWYNKFTVFFLIKCCSESVVVSRMGDETLVYEGLTGSWFSIIFKQYE